MFLDQSWYYRGVAFENFVIGVLLGKLQGRALCARALDSYVHTSTVKLEGQIFWVWKSLNIIGGVAFENFVIWAFLSESPQTPKPAFIDLVIYYFKLL